MLRVLTLSTLFPDATRPNFGIFVQQQIRAMANRDNAQITVVAPIGVPPRPLSRLGRFAKLDRVPTSEIWNGVQLYRPRFHALSADKRPAAIVSALTPILDTLKFDVIDASFFYPDGPAAVMLGRHYGVPVSIKARGSDIHHWGQARGTVALVLNAGRSADGLLAVSQAMKSDMVALGMPARRITVHYTGIDRTLFRPGDRNAAKNALGLTGPLVVSLGALIARKGHDVVIEALAALPGVTLAIVGEGPDRARLEQLMRSLDLGQRVRFMGRVAHDALPPLLIAADVMALASLTEGLANAWIEALACGTPIVITDAGGAREVVRSPGAGRVTIRDPLAFAAAIADLLANPPAPHMVAASVEQFSWSANAAALHAHLAGLVARRQPGGGQVSA